MVVFWEDIVDFSPDVLLVELLKKAGEMQQTQQTFIYNQAGPSPFQSPDIVFYVWSVYSYATIGSFHLLSISINCRQWFMGVWEVSFLCQLDFCGVLGLLHSFEPSACSDITICTPNGCVRLDCAPT